ncbi:hypothetical protein [Streptomyces dysideae]|uniref:hypothetical protein n=1 Tax=Streptomyces dysideae TaxID=909626 RepID=UPI001F15C6B6|nr:hypothetical protein [Streptomyces dysideae]
MVFSRRMAAPAAVVVIPRGIAATSFALTDSPGPPTVPPRVELDNGSPTPARTPTPTPPSTRPGADARRRQLTHRGGGSPPGAASCSGWCS